MPLTPPAGLCGGCRWARVVATRTGSRFVLCGRAETDRGFPRYPVLPVLKCRGYEPAASPPPAGGADPG